MKLGLIGKSLGHSFSAQYFRDHHLGPEDSYELKELSKLELGHFLKKTDWLGMNVTIPYKEVILGHLDDTSALVQKIGAANTIVRKENGWYGENTDVEGFLKSLEKYALDERPALILGTGGVSKAVAEALNQKSKPFQKISRSNNQGVWTYKELKDKSLDEFQLIINATPLGMYPDVRKCPDIHYEQINPEHICLDLVYNPGITEFLRRASQNGAKTQNGLEMLEAQADASWEIWTKTVQ